MKVAFIGISEFGAIILEGMIKSGNRADLVVTIFNKSPVKEIAEKYGIPVFQSEGIENAKLEIEKYKPELVVVAGLYRIILKDILDIPKYGCLNIHPSLLPRWRGPSPIQYTILNGDRETGISIVKVLDERTDQGQILAQRKIKLEGNETAKNLQERLANLGTRLLLETIPKWQKGLIKPQLQDETKVTFSKILTRADGIINWRETAEELERKIRAFNFWPGSYATWQKGSEFLKIEILKARVLKAVGGPAYPIGKTSVVPQNEICIQCGPGFLPGKGDFLVIEKLKLEGEREMSSEEFIRFHQDFIGTILK